MTRTTVLLSASAALVVLLASGTTLAANNGFFQHFEVCDRALGPSSHAPLRPEEFKLTADG